MTGPAHGDHGAGPALRRSADPEQIEAVFAELAADLAPVYRRRDLRANGVLYLRGLLMPGVVGNCWSIAEAVALERPYRLHHLLERACWEEDAARDVVRALLTRHLGADGGVLIFDETGQAKKGTKTAAVGRQYSGTMGQVENVMGSLIDELQRREAAARAEAKELRGRPQVTRPGG